MGRLTSRRLGVVSFVVCALVPGVATAHPGGLNKSGCHTNKATGEFHCHGGGGGGGGATKTAAPPPPATVAPSPTPTPTPAFNAAPESTTAAAKAMPAKEVDPAAAKPTKVSTVSEANASAYEAGHAIGYVIGQVFVFGFLIAVVVGIALGVRWVVRKRT